MKKGAMEIDDHGNVPLSAGAGSLADYLCAMVKANCKSIKRLRADTYGYLQRSFPSCTSEVDAWEARLVGQMAVIYSLDADQDGSVALVRLPSTTYSVGTRLVALQEVAPERAPFTKAVPDDYINEAGNNVLNSFRDYAGPLVGELPKVGWFEQVSQKQVG